MQTPSEWQIHPNPFGCYVCMKLNLLRLSLSNIDVCHSVQHFVAFFFVFFCFRFILILVENFYLAQRKTRCFHCYLAISVREYLSNSNIVVCLVFQFADYCRLLVCLAVRFFPSIILCEHIWLLLDLPCEIEVSFNLQIITITVTCTMPDSTRRIKWTREREKEKKNLYIYSQTMKHWILFSMNWKYVVRLNNFAHSSIRSALVVAFFFPPVIC